LFDRASSCPIMTVLTLKTIDRKWVCRRSSCIEIS
jgi:hypothetical protein